MKITIHPTLLKIMKNKYTYIIGSVIVAMFLFAGMAAGAKTAINERASDIEKQIKSLETLISITSEAYEQRAEAARKHRTHCSIAEDIEQELTDMQSQNSARRRQLKLLNSILPKGQGNT